MLYRQLPISIKPCPSLHHLTLTAKHRNQQIQLMGSFRSPFSIGNWPLAKRHNGNLIFASRMSAKATWGQCTWEDAANDCSHWWWYLHWGIKQGEKKPRVASGMKHAWRKKITQPHRACIHCNRDCHFCVGLYSHNRYCGITFLV